MRSGKILHFLHRNIWQRMILVDLGKRWLRRRYAGRPLPIKPLLRLRRLSSRPNALFTIAHGGQIANPFLATCLVKLGTAVSPFSLSPFTLNFLEQQLRTYRPYLILEFGSGLSTVCLARYLQELHGGVDRVVVVSVEQEAQYRQSTLELAEQLHLQSRLRVFHAPLCEQVIAGRATVCYDFTSPELAVLLSDLRPDFVLIDGPAGAPGIRYGTLPLARPFLAASARFFLDDALRDGELEIAQLWTQLPYIRVEGVYPVGDSLLTGTITNP